MMLRVASTVSVVCSGSGSASHDPQPSSTGTVSVVL
jgi:hypothetical protein